MPFEAWVVSHARVSKKPHKKATLEDTLTFFHQLSTLVSSGMPLLQSLKIATGQCESTRFRAVLEQITAKVAAGSTFYSSAAAFPQHFEFQWIEAIRTGEITGKMALVLVELNKQIRDSRETKRKVMASLMYPMILVCVAVIAVVLMLWMVVPTFAKMFHDMDAKLPAITQYVVDASNWIVKYGLYVVVGLVAAVVGFKQFQKTEAGRLYVGGLLMVMPSVGELMIGMAMYKFSSSIALLAQERRADDGDDEHGHGHLQGQPHLPRGTGTSPFAGGGGHSPCMSRSRRRGSSCPWSPTWSRLARNQVNSRR